MKPAGASLRSLLPPEGALSALGAARQALAPPATPKPTRASRKTRLALMASKPAQAGLEPRHSLPSGDRPTYSSDEGLS